MLITDIHGFELSIEEKKWLANPFLSGIILFARNIQTPEQTAQLCQSIRSINKNLLITVDQEGGRVMRLKNGFAKLPAIGLLGNLFKKDKKLALHMASQHAKTMALDVLSVGIDLSFAPVLDINHGLNDIIADRAFAQDRKTIVALSSAYIDAMRNIGMCSVGKHFPGHGGVTTDTHTSISIDKRSYKELSQLDLGVFADLQKANKLDALMMAHICYPPVDNIAAGFSSKWVTEILKTQLKFKGLVFSDDLTMHAATDVGNIETRLDLSIKAGCDYLIICNQPEQAQTALSWLNKNKPKVPNNKKLQGKFNQHYQNRKQMLNCPKWQKKW